MLLWLQKNLPKSIVLLGKLLAFSTSFHVIVLFVLFFIYTGENNNFSFQISKDILHSDAPVVFLPLYKRIAPKKALKSQKTIDKKKDIIEPKLSNEGKAKPAKIDKATTIVQAAPKKAKPQKKEKQELVKPEPAKIVPERKGEKEIALTQNAAQQSNETDIQYIGRDDLNALQMQEFINQEIGNHWNPPLGVPSDAFCEIKVIVNWQGALSDCKISKASKVIIFDISARKAVKAMAFPKWLWGKEFTITFQQ